MPDQSLPRPTPQDAVALVTLIESDATVSTVARDLAAALRAQPELLEMQFTADAAYLFRTYSTKVWAAQRAGLAVRGEDSLGRLAGEGEREVLLLAASDAGWRYQAFTDPDMTKLIACSAVTNKDAGD
jgi:hypothetical protein